MRLYLASNDLGDFSDKLRELVGDNRKTLLISNARDHRSLEMRKAVVDEDLGILRSCGLSPTELDLRDYIHQPEALRSFIDDYTPGCIFVIGGNLYSISTTMHLSGMADILRQDLAEDKYVYGGYSAGSMVTSKNLLNYLDNYGRLAEDRLEQAKDLYGETYTNGLGLIEEYVCPHADEEKFAACAVEAEKTLLGKNLTPIVLNNSDVAIMNNDVQLTIFRPVPQA